jgi:hypothetical protein
MTNVQNFHDALTSQHTLLEPLVKAVVKPKLGQWAGLDIVAIGPKGGKIVGYTAGGKPIYAGSQQAETLANQAKQQIGDVGAAHDVRNWVAEGLGIPCVVHEQGKAVLLSAAGAKLLEEHFGVPHAPYVTSGGHKSTKIHMVEVKNLHPHLGKPLTPQTPEQAATFSAKAGAGELDQDPFPPLSELTRETGTAAASVAAGSHGNWLFRSKDGRKWVFKKDDPVIARAEEAADRISRLVLGSGKAPAAKHVELDGESGVLLEWIEGDVLNQTSHNDPSTAALQKHFEEVVAHQVVDWLVSNHDGHAGNFLVNQDGLAAFDKGQAWRFFGEDSLSATYSPNPSKPIYIKFWSEFQKGEIKGDPIEAARKAIEAAEKMTVEQFQQVVMPYALERAKKTGGDAQQVAKQLAARLTSLRSDWETFLSKQLGKKVMLEKEHEDNFETMPELGLKEPDAVAMEETPVAPVQTEEVAGWPQTKGPVTITNPGSPPEPDVKWAKGYPGPGFQAQIKYKGQLFTVEFGVSGDKTMTVAVAYPDGTVKTFPSPNAASDSFVLYQKGLPLTMTATEKKKEGISYPAGTAFGIKKFKDELSLAQTTKPEDLKEKYDPESNWDYLEPKTDKEWLALVQGVLVGTTLKIERKMGTILLQKINENSWNWQVPNQPIETILAGDIVDEINDASTLSVSIAKVVPLPKEPAPKVDTEAAKVDVPASAPKTFSGPLPPGASKTVTKKFKDGDKFVKYQVALTALENGEFEVEVFDTSGASLVTETFESLSAASDWVWVNQKGYSGIEAYKTSTGKSKIPSGGGWKFWGIDPKAVTPPTNEPVKVMEAEPEAPGEPISPYSDPDPGWTWLTESDKSKTAIEGLPVGTKIKFLDDSGPWSAWNVTVKTAEGWQDDPQALAVPDHTVSNWVKASELPPMFAVPGGPVQTGLENWQSIDLNETALFDLPTGTKIRALVSGEPSLFLKQDHEKWVWDNGSVVSSMELRSDLEDPSTTYIELALPPKVVKEEPIVVEPDTHILDSEMKEKNLDAAPVGYQIKFWNKAIDKWATVEKQPDGDWKSAELGIVLSAADLAMPNDFIQGPKGTGPLVTEKPTPAPNPIKTKYPKAKLITDPSQVGGMPEVFIDKVNVALSAATDWSEQKDPNIPPVGAKSSHWASWVPPPGVWVEGEYEDPLSGLTKKCWMVVSVTGWSAGGEPHEGTQFAVMTEDGALQSGYSNKSAAVSAKEAVKAALGVDLKIGQIKEMFGLKGSVFAAGETLVSIKNGSGPSAVPSLSTTVDKAVPDMTDAEKKQPVKVSMTLVQAFKATFPDGKVEPGAGGNKLFVLPAKPGVNTTEQHEQLAAFLVGIGKPHVTSASHAGAQASVPLSMVDDEVVVTIGADKAVSYPSPSADNWETMPEGIPKVFSGSEDSGQIYQYLFKSPVGTQLVDLHGHTWVKVGADEWKLPSGESIDEIDASQGIWGIKISVVPPGSDAPPAKPKAKAKPKPKLPQKTAEQLEKEKQAKELSAWAKIHKPVTDEKAIQVLSHFQNLDSSVKLRARVAPDGELLLQPADPADAKKFDKMLAQIPDVGEGGIESPSGDWFKVGVTDLQAAIPGNKAATIEGPDGKIYPGGTTFKTKTVRTLLEEQLEAEVTKVVDHKTNENLKIAKLVGTEAEQKEKLEALAKKYDLEPNITTGGHYTMLSFPAAALKTVVQSEEQVIPTIPEQPSRFVSAALPSFGGSTKDGERVEQNRADLAILDTIVPPSTGHWIRCGKHATFWNDQVRVHRVRYPDGKEYYEVTGQLRDTSGLEDMTFEEFQFEDAAGTQFSHYSYKQQTYDKETGAIIKTGESFAQLGGRSATTPGGSKVNVVDDSAKEAMHGHFKVKIEVGADVELELAGAFAAMGLDPAEALAEPTDEDERLFIKTELLRSFGGAKEWRHPQKHYRNEKGLDARLKSLGVSKEVIESAEIRAGFNGKHVVHVVDFDDKSARIDAGCEFAYIGVNGLDSVFARIKEGEGFWSNRTKWDSGVKGSSSSLSSDHNGGGTSVSFARMGNVNADGDDWGFKCSGPKFILHPRVFERCDWIGFNGDAYGHWATGSSPQRQQAYNNKESSNEVDFEDGVSPRDLAGVTVNTQADKKQLMGWLENEGITEVNGIPLEDFIVVHGSNNRSQIPEKMVGLKDGVLS